MPVPWERLGIAFLFFLISTSVVLIIMPITTQTSSYNAKLHVYEQQTNYAVFAAIAVIVLITILIVAYMPTTTKTQISYPRKICQHKAVKEEFASRGIVYPLQITHHNIRGDNAYGTVLEMELEDSEGTIIYATALGNDDFDITESRQQFQSPLLGVSYRKLDEPNERGSNLTKAATLLKRLDKQDPTLKKAILERGEESAQKQIEDEVIE